MAKYKSNKFIDQFDSYKGLKKDDWEAFNRGEIVELDEVPEAAKDFLEKVNSSKKESK
tara:strand:+ start:244 stop:417 length:174 start_codon:yes stop_codon:yes gene_type:complete